MPGTGHEIVAHQQVESVPLQHHTQPTGVLLAPQVRQRIGHPDRQPDRDRPSHRCDDRFDLGQVVVRGGRARIEREHCDDGRRARRGADRQLFTAADSFVVTENDNRGCGRLVGRIMASSLGTRDAGPAQATASVKSMRGYRQRPTTLAVGAPTESC